MSTLEEQLDAAENALTDVTSELVAAGESLLIANNRIDVLESALREIELHHVAANIRRGRPEENSRTLRIVRAALLRRKP